MTMVIIVMMIIVVWRIVSRAATLVWRAPMAWRAIEPRG